jgi:putative transposase
MVRAHRGAPLHDQWILLFFIVDIMPGHRRSVRLPDVDYGRSGLYFVTLVTQDRDPLFGRIVDGQVYLSPAGEIVREEWLRTPDIRPGINLDEWIVMPDHLHTIIDIDSETHRSMKFGCVGAHRGAPCPSNTGQSLFRASRSLGSLIAQFKGVTTHRINAIRNTPGVKVWQRGYDEHIIRNAVELDKLRDYIRNNPYG